MIIAISMIMNRTQQSKRGIALMIQRDPKGPLGIINVIPVSKRRPRRLGREQGRRESRNQYQRYTVIRHASMPCMEAEQDDPG